MRDGQISYGELLLGAGTPYRWVELDGWDDLPALDSGDVLRPARHGAWPGTPYAQQRHVTLTSRIRTEPGGAGEAVRRLRRATAPPPGAGLGELRVRTGDGEELLAHARVSQRIISHARGYRIGWVPVTIQWTCPDPRRYWPTPSEVVVPAGGERPAPQSGDVATHPTVRIHGPCDTPVLRLHGDPDAVLGWDLELLAGEWLEIDTHAGTALDDTGASRAGELAAGSVPIEYWTIPPGAQRVGLEVTTSSDPARAWITYRHAYM